METLTDQEVTVVCADAIGLVDGYWDEARSCFRTYVESHASMSVEFRPLKDSNDERMVLEVVRKYPSLYLETLAKLTDFYREEKPMLARDNVCSYYFLHGKKC